MVEINITPEIVYAKGPGKSLRPPGKQSDIYYEQKLKEVFWVAADNQGGIIHNEESWIYLLTLLCKNRLASSRDCDRLESVRPSFPLGFDTFVNTIQQEFGD
jgi:hypothetical protein